MEVLIDTNFILTCVKQKVDFVSLADELFDEKIDWVVPDEVIEELKVISERKGEKTKDRESAKLSLELIENIKPKIVRLKNHNVDIGIVNYILGKKIILATLDRGLKNRIDNQILTIRGKKSMELI